MEIFAQYTFANWCLIFMGALIIGLSKAGLKGIDMLNVTIMAIVFGGKASTGVVLPLFCIADIMAVLYYHRHAKWPHFFKLMPWMLAGVLIGAFAGKDLNEIIFRKIMAVIIVLTVIIMVYLEWRKTPVVHGNIFFASGLGLVSGFTTMVGNLAGAFSNIYFLAMRMPKNNFISTAAWVFLVINFFKLPFQIFYWKNITSDSLKIDLLLILPLCIGFYAGIKIVNKIRDEGYRKVILALTLTGAVVIFLR